MTKTLTEQYKNKEISGWHYVKAKDGSINHWLLFTDSIEFDKDGDVKEVLAPVPSYDEYNELKQDNKYLKSGIETRNKQIEQLEKKLEIAIKALKEYERCENGSYASKALSLIKEVK